MDVDKHIYGSKLSTTNKILLVMLGAQKCIVLGLKGNAMMCMILLEISAAFHESLLTELLFLKFNSHIVTSELNNGL